MSVSVEADVSSPLSDGQSTTLDPTTSKSSSDSPDSKEDVGVGQDDKSESEAPKPHPMAFTIDFGVGKVDNRRLEELAKKSQARHQRVQSMSASVTRPTPPAQRPPMSAKLPRKAQGYNSEGYFSSDQEDSGLSGSIKARNSIAQNSANVTSPVTNRHIKSPLNDAVQPKRVSKSPIVDSIMSRSENFSLTRHGLNLPLKNSSYVRDVQRTPSYSNLFQSKPMADIADHSPEGVMLTDISSPELDILTPDNGLSTPEHSKSPLIRKPRATSETPDLFRKCMMKEPLYIDDDIDRHSDNSSTGTYTIEGDNYTEEQKARMSIDRKFEADLINEAIESSLKTKNEKDPELIFDFHQRVITKEPRRDTGLRSPLTKQTFELPKVSKDKNVLEISCCYESPTENDLAAQTSKQIKSTRSYLEKIKNRVRTITEKTFAKSPPRHEDEPDFGSFTSVTTSGVLSSKCPPKVELPVRRRCSLTKSDIDQTDYIHRLSRESSVPVSLPSNKLGLEDAKFESTALKNAQKALHENVPNMTPDQMVGKLSYLSLNRCKGDKTWIQDWAESVKKYNNNTLSGVGDGGDDKPPPSPKQIIGKPRSPHGGTPTKIPSPVGTLLHRRTPDLIPPQDTESYLLKTQNAITNLQAKLQSSRTSNFSSIPSQLTSSLISEKTAVSRLPVSQLSRSNSLNYRLRRKDNSSDNSPLRSPGHYVITGSSKLPDSTKILLNTASRSLDAEGRHDSNMNSPSSDRGVLSHSSDDKTLSNRYDVEAILSPHRKHARHKVDTKDLDNANQVCLKTVLKNNAMEVKYPRIDPTRCQGDKKLRNEKPKSNSIKRSSSFNTVNKNNNYLDPRINSRRSSGQSEEYNFSDESDNGSYDKDCRYKRQLHRGRIDSPDLKSIAPANSPRCPNTPEMHRKFGPGLVRNSVRVTNKERGNLTRLETPVREERKVSHQSRRISEPTRQAVLSRLTKSRSSTREIQPKNLDKGQKKPSQHRSSSALASKEIEFSNWKKRSSYDPMKAAQEGRRRQQLAKHKQDCNKDDLSSPSHSSPVHRSQSFHVTNIADLATLDYSSEETEDDQLLTLPVDPMITSTHSDILDLRPKDYRENLRRQAVTNDVALARDYVTNFQVNQPEKKRRDADKRKTFIMDDVTPTKENINFLSKVRDDVAVDKRKTFILDSDTNSTTNGSSPRNSSIFSHEKNSLTTGTSDTEGESGTESAPVVMRHPAGKRSAAPPKQRYSGDYSMSSSTTSITQKKQLVQPRYLDISKYKNESSPKNFLRRDPSKTYVGVLGDKVSKGSAQHYEMEQKKQELEKWKRRASYDPRKAAALGKTGKTAPKTASSVLRSQSFHGPMLTSSSLRYRPTADFVTETYDPSSDNDF
ncbi:uncharacterized protein LOC115453042 isoform X2 [Manduca sexta]|uniref:uncharacterized protein LOC115453042 isoform X2 n=1 Tax=Manduca sexta TaxID=7130 RepID=UPI00188F3438|nr:uncharacterized protein LOC115453042 isoform X2 [Manduca sexta]